MQSAGVEIELSEPNVAHESSSQLSDNPLGIINSESYHRLSEISLTARIKVLFFLCLYKLETEEDLRQEISYVPLNLLKNDPLGSDIENATYYHFA
jgi:hypothetical protein